MAKEFPGKPLLLALLISTVTAVFDPDCYIGSSDIYGSTQGFRATDLEVLERASDQLTLDHRITKITACVDAQSAASGKLNSVQLTAGLYGNAASDINLNTFGQMDGECDTFAVPQGETVIKMELAYDNNAVTAIQIGTSDSLLKMYGFVAVSSRIVRFTFDDLRPLIGLSGFSTTYPKGLAPVSLKSDCQLQLSELDALKAMWNETNTDDVKSQLRELYQDYAAEKEAQGVPINTYGFKTYQT